jgi:putative peptidoglycan lipid II flippase
MRRLGAGLAGAALLLGVVTIVARAAGFGRWLVFSKTVGDTCLGDAYNTANQLPNVVFEVVAGGALASVVVPVLAGAFARDDKAEASRTFSALLTWTLLALTPVAILAAIAAGPYAQLMLGAHPGCEGETAAVAGRMLLVFVPQLWFYGLAVVASGTLQAQNRFLAAALAPLASSLVVAGAYVAFGVLAGGELEVSQVPAGALWTLAIGTTAGVVALALTVVVPLARSGLSFRPSLRFPEGVGRQARALATAGIAALVAQQLVTLVITWLANHRGESGTLTLYTWAFAIFMLPYAVLAAPVATTVFPRVSAQVEGFERTAALAIRAVTLLGLLGGALLAGTAVPVARVFVLGPGSGDTGALATALVTFAVAVPSYGLLILSGRLLYARGRGGLAAIGTVLGWAVVAGVAVRLTGVVGAGDVAAALGGAMSAGLLVGALALLSFVGIEAGRPALDGLPRAVGAGLLAALVAAVAGQLVGRTFGTSGLLLACAGTLLSAIVVTTVFAGIVAVLDRPDARLALARLRRRSGP